MQGWKNYRVSVILFEASFSVTTFLAAVHGSSDGAVLICVTLPLHIPLAGRRSAVSGAVS